MKQKFALDRHNAVLASYTPRREFHGEDPQPAATLYFTATLDAHELAMFAPSLPHFLFEKPGKSADLADAGKEHGALRFPEITSRYDLDTELVGAELSIHYGIDDKSDIVLPGCKVDKVSVKPEKGAVATLAFRCACHPDEQQSGKLAMMIDTACEITLTPPGSDLVEQAEGEDRPLNTAGDNDAPPAEGGKKGGKRKARANAEAAFS